MAHFVLKSMRWCQLGSFCQALCPGACTHEDYPTLYPPCCQRYV